MHKPALLDETDRFRHPQEPVLEPAELLDRYLASSDKASAIQAAPRQILGYAEGHAVVFADIQHLDDRRMLKLNQVADFAAESLSKAGIFQHATPWRLDYDGRIQVAVVSVIGEAHPAFAQLRTYFVPSAWQAQGGPDCRVRGCWHGAIQPQQVPNSRAEHAVNEEQSAPCPSRGGGPLGS